MSDIKPCPFCGGTQVEVREGSMFRWRYTMCGECGAQAPEVRADTLAWDHDSREADARVKAIAEWNRRVPDPEVERLRAMTENRGERLWEQEQEIDRLRVLLSHAAANLEPGNWKLEAKIEEALK